MRLYKKLMTYILAGAVATTSLPASAAGTANSAIISSEPAGAYTTDVSNNEILYPGMDDVCSADTTYQEPTYQENACYETIYAGTQDAYGEGCGITEYYIVDQDPPSMYQDPSSADYDPSATYYDPVSADYELFETGLTETAHDTHIDMPDPDELLEGYLETQIFEETGDEDSLKGYDPVIDTEDSTEPYSGLEDISSDYVDLCIGPDDISEDSTEPCNGLDDISADSIEPLMSSRYDNLADLNPVYTKCYDVIKEGAVKLASGEESIGRFQINFKDMGIQTKFTAKELGVDRIAVYSYQCNDPDCGYINQGKEKPDECEKCHGTSLSQLFDYTCKECGKIHRQTQAPDKCSECENTSFKKVSLRFGEDAKAAATKKLRSASALVSPTYTVVWEESEEPGGEKIKKYIPGDSIDSELYIAEGTDMDELKAQYTHNRYTLLYSLLADIPYELYWFNKVSGWKVIVTWKYGGDTGAIDCGDSYITFWMPPVPEYKDKESASAYACDTELTSAAAGVIPKARAIAEEAENTCSTDYEKLLYFKHVIQDELAPVYNSAATSSWEGKYGNPWQLIWVFDEDLSTNVVCEGYSKAFKLLCDLSDFDYEGFDCYLISGYYNKSGNGHMWNSVAMDDGYNYLIDITNSKPSTQDPEGMRAFMRGATDYDGTWYSYANGYGTTKYSYKDGATYVFSEDELTMSRADYIGALELTLDTPPAGGYSYTGLPVEPIVRDVISTKDGHSLVANNEDYVLVYPDNDNVNAGTKYVYASVTGRNINKNTAMFNISPGSIGDLCVASDICAQAYTDGNRVNTEIDVYNKYTGKKLDQGKDYSVEYKGTRNLGTAKIRILGAGNYSASLEKTVNMVIKSDTIQVELEGDGEDESGEVKSVKYSYSGEEVRPEVIVTNLATGNPLVDKKDYTLSYKNNINAGTAQVIITGKGTYTSTSDCNFVISPLDINDESIYMEELVAVQWNGKRIYPVPEIRFRGQTLSKGNDYTVTYIKEGGEEGTNSITEPGRYIMRIRGKRNFDPDTYKDVELNVFVRSEENIIKSVRSLNVESIPDRDYKEKGGVPQEICPAEEGLVIVRDPAKPGVLTPYSEVDGDPAHTDYDYTVSYSHNKAVGTGYVIITGNEANGYTGQVSIPFKINGTPISKARVEGLYKLTLNESVYTGKEVTLEALADSRVSVTVNGVLLRYYNEETGIGDYIMTYENNTNAGTATVNFIGKNGYTGTLKKTFKITPRNISSQDSGITVTVVSCIEDDTQDYATAEYMKGGAKPQIIVTHTDKDGNPVKILKESVDYKLTYSNNKKLSLYEPAGKVTIKGIGNYTGTLTRRFFIKKGNLDKSVELYAPDIAVKPGKEKSGNYKSKVTVKGPDGKALSSGTDYLLTYYREIREDEDEEESGAIQLEYVNVNNETDISSVKVIPLAKKDKVTAGDRIYITIEAKTSKKLDAKKYEDEPDEVFCYRRTIYSYVVLETSNDISGGVFKVAAKDYSGAPIELNESDFTDAKPAKKSTIRLKMGEYDPVTMTSDDDCDYVIIGYSNNIKKGTAKVTVRGVNGYSGTKTVSFKIGSKRFIWW